MLVAVCCNCIIDERSCIAIIKALAQFNESPTLYLAKGPFQERGEQSGIN